MEMLLSYFYKGTADLSSWLDGRELLQAAHKYQVEPLVQHCARFLETVLTLSNVCYIYNDATLYSLATLREKCLELIRCAGFSVLRSKSFEVLTKEAAMDVIRYLNMKNAAMVLEVLLRWARMQCYRLGLPVTEANIFLGLDPFLEFLRDLSKTEKSALSPSVPSLMSARSRSSLCVPHYCPSFTLREVQDTTFEHITPTSELIAFSLSAPAYMMGLRFALPLPSLDCIFNLTLMWRARGSISSATLCHTANIQKGKTVIGVTSFDVEMTLDKPFCLEANKVYKLAMAEKSQRFLVSLRTRVETETVLTARGPISLKIHHQKVYGITGIRII